MLSRIKLKTLGMAILFMITVLSSGIFAGEVPTVLVSIKPLKLIVDDLAGAMVETQVLVEGANSPHHFALRISDRKKIQQAKLVVWVGPDLERFLEGVLVEDHDASRSLTFSTLEGLTWPDKDISEHHHQYSIGDPHLWLSLHNVGILARALVKELAQIRPDQAGELEKRLREFDRQLVDLNTEAQQTFENAGGSFAVYHDGFSHFTRAYNLNQLAALTLVPEEQISARRLARLKVDLREAKCLIVDKSELHIGERYADVLELPLVQVDLLAADKSLTSFASYYRVVIDGFGQCFFNKAPEGMQSENYIR